MNIGLENGVLLRTVIDSTTGDLSDTRTRYVGIALGSELLTFKLVNVLKLTRVGWCRYLGSRGVKLFSVTQQEKPAILALSSRPWLSYQFQGHSRLTPLSYVMFPA